MQYIFDGNIGMTRCDLMTSRTSLTTADVAMQRTKFDARNKIKFKNFYIKCKSRGTVFRSATSFLWLVVLRCAERNITPFL